MDPIICIEGVLLFTVCVYTAGRVIRSRRQYGDYNEAHAAAARERRPGVLAWVERNHRAREIDLPRGRK